MVAETQEHATVVIVSAPKVTFVFPCLNEEATLAHCVQRVRTSLTSGGAPFEIIVADNGSTDRSREIAAAEGCRVVPVPVRGYGAALRAGILAAESEYVMFADSDSTYLYEDAAPLYEAAQKHNVDMAIASRMTGKIEPGAMPPLHRYLGTPVLTTLINWMFGGHLTDCNSGFRCVRKSAFEKWDIRATGMEFASELLIKALKHKASMVEIKSGLRPGPPGRVAHLHTWRDGMRHLLFILSEKPALFEWLGLALLIVGSLLQLMAAFTGPTALGGFHVFDVHSQALLLLSGLLGGKLYLFSCMLYGRSHDLALPITRKLISLNEGVLFFTLVAILAAIGGVAAWIFFTWIGSRFSNLHLANVLLVWVHFLAVGLEIAIGLLGVHVLKKASHE